MNAFALKSYGKKDIMGNFSSPEVSRVMITLVSVFRRLLQLMTGSTAPNKEREQDTSHRLAAFVVVVAGFGNDRRQQKFFVSGQQPAPVQKVS